MASTDNLTNYHIGHEALRRRSSSISPSETEQTRPRTRRSILSLFTLKTNDNSDPSTNEQTQRPSRRKSMVDMFWTPLKGDGFYKETNQTQDQQQAESPTNQGEERGRRCSSRFRSISSVIKSSFWKVTRRKDSTMNESAHSPTSPGGCGVGTIPTSDMTQLRRNEIYRYTAAMEPYALQGYLNFRNASVDDLEQFLPGPSNYYLDDRYLERPCSLSTTGESYCTRPRGNSLDLDSINRTMPTAATNAEAGAHPHLWRSLSGRSPAPVTRRSRHVRKLSIHQITDVIVPSRRASRAKGSATVQSPCISPRGFSPVSILKNRAQRRPSCAPSVASRFTVSDPPKFGPEPDLKLNFRPSLSGVGVLPTIDASSCDSNSIVPPATYTTRSGSQTSMVPLQQAPTIPNANHTAFLSSDPSVVQPKSTSSSLLGHHPSSYSTGTPPSPALHPVENPESSGLTPPSLLPSPFFPTPNSTHLRPLTPSPTLLHPTHPLSTLNISHTHSTPKLLLTVPTPSLHNHSPGGRSSATAADNLSTHTDLGLRRMSSLGDILEQNGVDGDGTLGMDVEEGEVGRRCGVECCGVRGRSRVRRGDAW